METRAPLLGEPLSVELMNTIWADRDGVHDALASTDAAAAWLRAIAPRTPLAITDSGVDIDLIDKLSGLRDGLRRVAAEVTFDPRERAESANLDVAAAVAAINIAATAAPSWPTMEWNGGQPRSVLNASGTAPAALVSYIAEQGVGLLTGEQRLQLRACLAPGCVLYFIKSHPRREWCSAACGNRARVARHYQRNQHGD